jgi:carbonic anhydrase
MENLFAGVKNFNSIDFLMHKEHFQKISKTQKPHTLFIGCSDSRVVPSLITKTLPGELFVIRNIANLVPNYRVSKEFLATTSSIEYAVKILNVSNIIVCGHSNCGGCKAIFMNDEAKKKIPHTAKWLELSVNVKEKILAENIENDDEREVKTEMLNIVEQMNHLLSYPYIHDQFLNNKLNILGWYYIIQTGEVFNYNKNNLVFEKIQ